MLRAVKFSEIEAPTMLVLKCLHNYHSSKETEPSTSDPRSVHEDEHVQ